MVGKVIYNLLTTSTELTDLIGSKVFPLISEDETIINYIVYERRSTQPTNTKLKRSTVDVISYDIMIFTDGLEIMNDIALGVRNALDQYKGVNSGLWIDNIVYTGENDEYEPESNVFGKFMSFDVRFNNIYSTLKQPTNLTTTATSTEITLNWDDNATGETGYKVYRSTNLRDYELITSLGSGIENYEDTDVVIDTVYYYFIVPYNSVGNGYASDVVADKLGGGDIRVTFDNNLIAETSVDINIDCSTVLDVAIITNNATFNGTYTANGTQNGQTKYVNTVNSNLVIIGGAAWQVKNLVGVTINQDPPTGQDYPWEADWGGQLTMVQATIENYCGGGVCADATVNVNGNLFNTVASGVTLDVVVEYENGTPVGTIVSGVVEIPNPITQSGIAYQRPPLTGQVTSYRTGDDGWHFVAGTYDYTPPPYPIHTVKLVDFVTLENNNIFGNTDRFTDDLGTQVFANGVFIDHFTKLMWTFTRGFENWDNSIDNANSYVDALGNSDYRLANENEKNSIYDVKDYGFNYNPLNTFWAYSGGNFHTSTTNKFATTENIKSNRDDKSFGNPKTTGAYGLRVRNWEG